MCNFESHHTQPQSGTHHIQGSDQPRVAETAQPAHGHFDLRKKGKRERLIDATENTARASELLTQLHINLILTCAERGLQILGETHGV
jgi:hypothetical protein